MIFIIIFSVAGSATFVGLCYFGLLKVQDTIDYIEMVDFSKEDDSVL